MLPNNKTSNLQIYLLTLLKEYKLYEMYILNDIKGVTLYLLYCEIVRCYLVREGVRRRIEVLYVIIGVIILCKGVIICSVTD
ncbi:hypothetical protein CWI37_0559p0030 [Hamiltosporidium tvaerminnensis]|uniref:Uncharacterized protein n=1 Tax=Hamiltosporidium tvaerminnensis TaxID=1176355 RepID=A0A4Q9L3K9_9MICR|nr:hypothetical protein CWI37_0559p0030 [Hamiltosporidium tvaerminnensis]